MLVLLAAVATGAVAQTTHKVSMKEGTEDATSWQGKAGEGTYQQLPLEGVAAGKAVTVKYNGTKKVKSVKAVKKSGPTYPIALSEVTADYLGSVVTTDGNVYATVSAATTAGKTAVAMIAYVSGSNGMAIALADEGSMNWNSARSTCGGKTAIGGKSWKLPTMDEWKQMFSANGGNEIFYTNLNTALSAAGGDSSKLQKGSYWSSSETGEDDNEDGAPDEAWYVELQDDAYWEDHIKSSSHGVRAVLAF